MLEALHMGTAVAVVAGPLAAGAAWLVVPLFVIWLIFWIALWDVVRG